MAKSAAFDNLDLHFLDHFPDVIESLDFTGQASVREVYFEDYAEPYSYASRDSYEPGVKKLSTDGPAMTYTFMPHSFTQIIVKVDD